MQGYHPRVVPELDNPIWCALQTRHRALALGTRGFARYPGDFAPFAGVAGEGAAVEVELGRYVAAGETMYLLGVAPRVSSAWHLELLEALPQMVCTAAVALPDGPDIVALGAAQHADTLALTALVYPHYFRPRTRELGRYFGIYADGRLAAMAGERFGGPQSTELSAICTHPDYRGRGFARRLMAYLGNDILARGRTPYLHVNAGNAHAIAVYASVGYRLRRRIPFWALRKA